METGNRWDVTVCRAPAGDGQSMRRGEDSQWLRKPKHLVPTACRRLLSFLTSRAEHLEPQWC